MEKNKIKFKRTNKDDLLFLLRTSPEGITKFRYFDKREIEIIYKHLLSFIYYFEEEPIAYVHIDEQDGTYWFGILISDKYVGNGISKFIMEQIINICDILKIDVFLSVDKNNNKAINLYVKYDFFLIEEKEKFYVFKRNWR